MEKLLSSFKLGVLQLKNRIVMSPMTRQFSPGHFPNRKVKDYYKRRARGGVGLIISEGTCVNHNAANGYNDVPFFFGDRALAGWKEIVEEVHTYGCAFFPQLWHVGAMRDLGSQPNQDIEAVSPSGLMWPDKKQGRSMTQSDIDDVIRAFGLSAKSAVELGCDGLEIHAAHGYLIDQFFWEGTNKRSDNYGGSTPRERTRFAVEVIEEVRKNVGADFPVSLRLSQWKQQEFSARLVRSPKELEQFLQPLTDAGVDIFHCSTRRYWEPEFKGSSLNLAGWVKKITGKPTITVGSVGLDAAYIENEKKSGVVQIEDLTEIANFSNLDSLIERLNNDEFDLVAVGRALIANPDWVRKIESSRFEEIRPFKKEMLSQLY
jgi:2,4-dienoyl-CoA reductase-like NADH-dependent reductase (Old Yellow Enzyme family)